jgi:hypothetical protein
METCTCTSRPDDPQQQIGSAHGKDRTAAGSIIADIKLLACNFSSMSFIHVTRSANEVAHVPARSGEQSADLVFQALYPWLHQGNWIL